MVLTAEPALENQCYCGDSERGQITPEGSAPAGDFGEFVVRIREMQAAQGARAAA